MLARRRTDRAIVGLTSARNAAFVRGLGLYSQVTTYDEIATLPDVPTVCVDVAGDARVQCRAARPARRPAATTVTVGCRTGIRRRAAHPGGERREPTLFFFAPGWLSSAGRSSATRLSA
jgi:hypothetical protein